MSLYTVACTWDWLYSGPICACDFEFAEKLLEKNRRNMPPLLRLINWRTRQSLWRNTQREADHTRSTREPHHKPRTRRSDHNLLAEPLVVRLWWAPWRRTTSRQVASPLPWPWYPNCRA